MIDFAPFQLNSLEFPGRAGELQRAGDGDALVAELGENYPSYHAHLARLWRDTGGRPDPRKYSHDRGAYVRASDYATELLVAEALLRRARAHGRMASGADHFAEAARPLVSQAGQLLSVELSERDTPVPWFPPTAPRP